jgi:hypothetical protein
MLPAMKLSNALQNRIVQKRNWEKISMFDEMELLHTSSLKVSTEKYYEHFCGGRERERSHKNR